MGPGLAALVYGFFKTLMEKAEPTAPATMRFDWDAYRNDISKMSVQAQMRKVKRGGYYTTEPAPEKTLSMEDVVDVERYKRDKEMYSDAYVEMKRKNGSYRYIRKY